MADDPADAAPSALPAPAQPGDPLPAPASPVLPPAPPIVVAPVYLPGSPAEPIQHQMSSIPGVSAGDFSPGVLGKSHVVKAPEPVPLRSDRVALWVFVVGVIAALAAHGLGVLIAADESITREEAANRGNLVAGLGILVLVGTVAAWTWVTVDNARRLMAYSRRANTISPWRAVFWWFSIPLVGVPLVLLVGWLINRFVDPPDAAPGNDGDIARLFVWLVVLLALVVLWVQPYLYLARIARRSHLDPSVFTGWLWKPGLTAVLSVFVSTVVVLNNFNGTGVADAAIVTALGFGPMLMWCWCGWRAFKVSHELLWARSASQYAQRELYLQVEVNAGRLHGT